MSLPTIEVTVDAKAAIAAFNDLTAAIERAHAALQKLTVFVEPTTPKANSITAGDLRADRIAVGTLFGGNGDYRPHP